MAKQVKLAAQPRTEVGRSAVRKLKARGAVPAVIYGAKDKAEPLQILRRDINALLSHASGENILVELEVAGKNRLALVQEVQHAPVGREVMHVDFHAVSVDELIEAEVPIEPMGVAEGVKNFGGLLEQSVRALEVECLPKDLPDKIIVDVSALNIGDSIHVRDIGLPEGVRTKIQPELTVFSVLEPAVEEEPAAEVAAAEAAAAAGPEVIREKKEEGEGAVPTPAAAAKEKEPKK
jgi:large subunit ribosomal protein L25